MADIIENFFIPDNEVHLSDELDYSRAADYIRTAEAFARSTYQSVYIIDYFRRNFMYVSPNPVFLCGLTPRQVIDLGYGFYVKHVPKDELPFLLQVNRAGFAFLKQIQIAQRNEWYISYDFHLTNNNGRILINHKLTPLTLTTDGRIWLALCVVSLSTNSEAGHVEAHRSGHSDYYTYNIGTRRWDKRASTILTDGEKTVITLSIQGLTMAEIADRICLSPDSVKKYRQRIFEKLGVRNISEAIVACTNNKLL